MLEIDNRYPEYARPYEPVKGRKRHGPLNGNQSAFARRRLRRLDMTRRGFLTGVGVLIMFTVLMPEAKVELKLPKVEPIVIQIEQPVPEPEPEVIPEIKDPEELPVVIPDPKPTPPEPKPTPPKPKPKPEDKKIAPVVDLEKAVQGPDPEMYDYPTLFFTMKLNDLKGGKATGRIYADTGSGFYEPDSTVTVVYDPNVVSGDTWSDEISCLITAPAGGGVAGKAKIVFDIVYPDGKTARIESETRPVHNGSYVKVNTSYGSGGCMRDADVDPETGDPRYIFKVDVLIDKTLVDPQKVDPLPDDILEPASLWRNGSWDFYDVSDVECYTDSSGNHHLLYVFYSSNPFSDGTYWFAAKPKYPEDDHNYNVWVPIHFEHQFIVP